MNEDILFRVKEQLSKDYNCTIEDFNNQNTLITDKRIIESIRKYSDEDEILKILIFNGKAIISADKCIKEWCIKNLSKFPGAWMFIYSNLRKIDKKLSEFGYEIDNTHHYYLPKYKEFINENNVKLKWYEKMKYCNSKMIIDLMKLLLLTKIIQMY